MSFLITIVLFVIVLGVLVFAHELGHFLAARKTGMKVEEFGFGFPPRLFGIQFFKTKGLNGEAGIKSARGEIIPLQTADSTEAMGEKPKKKWRIIWGNARNAEGGSTVYSINWIPFGGFVKILGENRESASEGSFATKSVLSRFFVLVAGVGMNFILAWLLLASALSLGIPMQLSESESLPAYAKAKSPQVMVSYVEPQSPADLSGFRPGDILLSVEGKNIAQVRELQDLTAARAGQKTRYTVLRGSETFDRTIIPRTNPPEGQGPLGIQPILAAKVSYPLHIALAKAASIVFSLMIQIFLALAQLIGGLFTDRSLVASLTGPVGIAVMTHQAAQMGFSNLLYFASVLSINLGIINALPFPALDGGRMLFLIIEKIRKKRISEKIEGWANSFGFILLLFLVAWITLRDIARFSPGLVDFFKKIFNQTA